MKEEVRVTFPAESEYLTAIRLLSSAVATKGGFDVDSIEDIRLCASEACLLLIEQNHAYEAIEMKLRLSREGIEICAEGKGVCEKKPSAAGENEELSEQILEELTDLLEISRNDGVIKSVRFTIKSA
ncbi:MAG: ATP-binding protein [Bacillota bacterium]|nr:ATP-binding protein [Bacillota bacterium]